MRPDDDSAQQRLRTICLVFIALVAAIASIYLARELLLPLTFSLLFAAMLRPIVRGFERMRFPAPAASAIVVLGFIALLAAVGYLLSYPTEQWMAVIPHRFEAAQSRLEQLRRPIERATKAIERVENAASGSSTAPSTNPAQQKSATQPAGTPSGPQMPPAIARFVGTTTSLLSSIIEFFLLLYLLLASGDLFVQKLVKRIATVHDKKLAVQVVGDVQLAVLRYMMVTALINLGQAIVIGGAMWLLGMPSPLLWGLFTFVLEFIPYLGGTIMVALLTVFAFATFDNLGHVLAVPACYLLVTTIQNNVVSPVLYGKRLKLNPVAVLVAVLFWWFLWGVGGAFIAVPMVATVKIICDRTQSCKALGEFLGE